MGEYLYQWGKRDESLLNCMQGNYFWKWLVALNVAKGPAPCSEWLNTGLEGDHTAVKPIAVKPMAQYWF
jgi:hypothetical protein